MLKKLFMLMVCAAIVLAPATSTAKASTDASLLTVQLYHLVRSCIVTSTCGTVPPATLTRNRTLAQCAADRVNLTPLFGQFPYTLSCIPGGT
jgi:hypothetical protein